MNATKIVRLPAPRRNRDYHRDMLKAAFIHIKRLEREMEEMKKRLPPPMFLED